MALQLKKRGIRIGNKGRDGERTTRMWDIGLACRTDVLKVDPSPRQTPTGPHNFMWREEAIDSLLTPTGLHAFMWREEASDSLLLFQTKSP